MPTTNPTTRARAARDGHRNARAAGRRSGPAPGTPEPVRRRIVTDRRGGATWATIADNLNTAGHLTPTGKRWSRQRVAQVHESCLLDAILAGNA